VNPPIIPSDRLKEIPVPEYLIGPEKRFTKYKGSIAVRYEFKITNAVTEIKNNNTFSVCTDK
jgi:hypothetical protein